MNEVSKEDKEAMYRLITKGAEVAGDSAELGDQYLRELGYDPEKLADEGVRRINQIISELEAEKARNELAKKVNAAKDYLKPWKDIDRSNGSDQGIER